MLMPDRDNPGQFVDIGQVGEVEAINSAVVKALQDDAFIPVISPIGFGEDGLSYNINADLVAGKLAVVLNAEKLVMMTNIPGVMDKAGNLLTDLSAREIDGLFADGTISGGMLPKISSALGCGEERRALGPYHRRAVSNIRCCSKSSTEQPFGTMIRLAPSAVPRPSHLWPRPTGAPYVRCARNPATLWPSRAASCTRMNGPTTTRTPAS